MTLRSLASGLAPALVLSMTSCSSGGDADEAVQQPAGQEGNPSPLAAVCDADNRGIALPDGFCAIVVVDSLPGARHIDVAPNGDLFVAVRNRRETRNGPIVTGGVAVLRDNDADGRVDEFGRWGVNGGNDVLFTDGYVYHAPDDAVLRYPFTAGSLTPSGPPDTVVSGLPDTRNHTAKSIALGFVGARINHGLHLPVALVNRTRPVIYQREAQTIEPHIAEFPLVHNVSADRLAIPIGR